MKPNRISYEKIINTLLPIYNIIFFCAVIFRNTQIPRYSSRWDKGADDTSIKREGVYI